MATVPVQRKGLQLISNIPDWTPVQSKGIKNGSAAPLKPLVSKSTPTGKKVKTPTASRPKPVSADVNKIKESKAVVEKATLADQKDPVKMELPDAEGHVRRIYSREFLIKFRYTAPSFPPGAPTPIDIIAQYNLDYERKEAAAAQQDLSSLSTPTTSTTSTASLLATTSDSPSPKTESTAAFGSARQEGNKTYRLRIREDDSILGRPMFSPMRQRTPVKSSSARSVSAGKTSTSDVADKENSVNQPAHTLSASKLDAKRARVTPAKPKTVTVRPKKDASLAVSTTKADMADKENVPIAAAPSGKSSEDLVAAVKAESAAPSSSVDPTDALAKKLVAILKESDPRRLAQRQKQIDFGKNTNGYQEYVKLVPKSRRRRDDPKTPPKHQVCSKRSWDGQIRKWRRMLHQYDPTEPKTFEDGPDEEAEDVNDVEQQA